MLWWQLHGRPRTRCMPISAAESAFISCRISEPWFYPLGARSVLADSTYTWDSMRSQRDGFLAAKLIAEYGMAADAFRLRLRYFIPTLRTLRVGETESCFYATT